MICDAGTCRALDVVLIGTSELAFRLVVAEGIIARPCCRQARSIAMNFVHGAAAAEAKRSASRKLANDILEFEWKRRRAALDRAWMYDTQLVWLEADKIDVDPFRERAPKVRNEISGILGGDAGWQARCGNCGLVGDIRPAPGALTGTLTCVGCGAGWSVALSGELTPLPKYSVGYASAEQEAPLAAPDPVATDVAAPPPVMKRCPTCGTHPGGPGSTPLNEKDANCFRCGRTDLEVV